MKFAALAFASRTGGPGERLMYRIELGPNDVGVFRSIEELAAGIRTGVITARARIYHQASDKWLPIEVHPHYRKALELVQSGAAPPSGSGDPQPPSPRAHPEQPAPAPPISEPAGGLVPPSPRALATKPVRGSDGPVATPPTIAGAPVIALPPDLPDEFVHEAIDPPPSRGGGDTRSEAAGAEPPAPRPVVRSRLRLRLSRRARRPVLLALSGIALALSTGLGLWSGPGLPHVDLGLSELRLPGLGQSKAEAAGGSRRSPPAPGREPVATPAKSRALEPAGTPSFGGSSAFATPRYTPPLPEAAVPPAERPPEIAPPPPEPPIAVPLATGSDDALGTAGLVARYQAAYDAARADLETGLRTAGFADLFAPAKLATPEGVRLGRLSAGTAAAYLARYRQREAEIERAYADSVRALTLRYGWSGVQRRPWDTRRVLQEGPEVAKLASFLLQSLDSLYGLLAAQEGRYRIADGRIAFEDAGAARAYAELRPWLDRRAHAWADTASGPPTTAAQILRAMGSARLPEGGSL